MANIKQAFEYAAQNPDSDFATNLKQLAASGSLNQEAEKYGIDLSAFQPKPEPNLAQTIVGGLIKAPTDLIGAGFAGAGALGSYAGKKLAGQDTTLSQEYANQSQQVQQSGANAIVQPLTGQEIRPAQTAQELTGDVLQTGAIAMPGVGLVRGAATGAALLGGQAMSEGQSALDVAKNTLIGGAGGAALGVALPALESLLGSAVKSLPKVAEKVGGTLTPDPAGIMQRVLRTTKGQQANFEQKYGTSIGQYAVDRGLIGTQEKVVNDLANRFTTSIKAADDALASLPGKYQPEPVKTALQQLYQKKLATSAPGAADPELDLVKGLLAKFENGGLDMTDINQAKRLFERNVKLDFVRTNNPEGVTMSNNVDNAIREWQFSQAERLGLKNLPEINKETRMAKDLLNSLEREASGKAGNNAISLTDWIVLADGGASNIATFLAKKGFSSDTAQAFVAKYFAPKAKVGLPSAKMEAPQIDATVQSYFDFLKKTGATFQGTSKKVNQQILQKESPLKETIPQSTKGATDKVENSVVQIVDTRTGRDTFKVIPKGELKKFDDLIDNTKTGIAGQEIEGKVYHLTAKTPDQMKKAGFIDDGVAKVKDIPVKSLDKSIPKELQPLAEEARKYKSPQDFVIAVRKFDFKTAFGEDAFNKALARMNADMPEPTAAGTKEYVIDFWYKANNKVKPKPKVVKPKILAPGEYDPEDIPF